MTETLFISAGPIEWGSSRMRCWWPAKYMDAEVVIWNYPRQMEFATQYRNYIFQKYGAPDVQKRLLDMGFNVWLDQCDPMWWFSDQSLMRAMFENATGAVFSSEALRLDFLDWWGENYPTYTIPDRLELSHFTHKKSHAWTKPVRFIWYGVAQNRVALSAAWSNLSRLRINGYHVTLTVSDDRPDMPVTEQNDIPILQSTWQLDKEVPLIAGHDVALLPPYPGPWGKVKSNNKNITATACNVPYTDGQDYYELVRLMDHVERKKTVHLQSAALDDYNVKISAREWEALFDA